MCFLSLSPSAKLTDVCQIDIQIKGVSILCQYLLIGRTIEIVPCQTLCLIGIQIIQIFGGNLSVPLLSTTSSTTATDGWHRILMLGVTISYSSGCS